MRPAATYSQVLGQVIEAHRKQRGMTQFAFGAALGTTQSAYSRLERGESAFSMPQLKKLATHLGVSPGDLFSTTDRAVSQLSANGVTILDDRPREESPEWLWVAGAVVAAVVVVVMLAQKGK